MITITKLARGRRFADAIPDGENFRLRFLDGYEIVVAWDSSGPIPIGYAQGIITSDIVFHKQFRYVRGKTVSRVTTDGETLTIEFTDNHSMRCSFKGSEPVVEGIDAKVVLHVPGMPPAQEGKPVQVFIP